MITGQIVLLLFFILLTAAASLGIKALARLRAARERARAALPAARRSRSQAAGDTSGTGSFPRPGGAGSRTRISRTDADALDVLGSAPVFETPATGGGQASPRTARISRVEALPRLKRAIVWAEILGPPRGLWGWEPGESPNSRTQPPRR